MKQLVFNFAHPPASRRLLHSPGRLDLFHKRFAERLRRYFPMPFVVRFNDNTSTMISSRMRGGRVVLRLHHMFIEADDATLEALAGYLRGSLRSARRLDRFIEKNMSKVSRRLPARMRARGRKFDLEKIRDALNRMYFAEPVKVPVVWGVARKSRRRRSIRLGSYSFEDRIIRIHPVLDQDFVPPCVVVGVVYHEMLHHLLGSRSRKGRRLVHTREFRQREQLYVHHRRAEVWEKENISRLLAPPSRA